MNLLLWILFGALVGWLALLLSNRPMPFQMISLGVAGSIFGGWATNVIFSTPLNSFNIYSVMIAVLSAAFVLYIFMYLHNGHST